MFPSGKHFRTAHFVLFFVDFFPLKKKRQTATRLLSKSS